MHHPLPPGFDMAKEQYQFADELNNYLDWELDQENKWTGD